MHSVTYYSTTPFWDDSFKALDYANEDFNAPDDVTAWQELGYRGPFTGDLCDMRKP